jgi:dTDP-4-amino-4,6-dideoxygalactose transaminase
MIGYSRIKKTLQTSMKTHPYGKQFIDSFDIQSITKAAKQDLITTGPSVKIFENKLTKILQCKYVSSCNSGTSAIHLSLIAINLKKNDVVIMPAINFIAAYSMCLFMEAKVFLADVDPLSGQMTPETLLECIKINNLKKVKAVITMYMGGYPENVVEFSKIKKKYNFYLIEDACHAFGAKYKYKKNFYYIGSCKHSDISTFSLHPVKTFTTGEGGLVTTNNRIFDSRIRKARSHGIERDKKFHWKYDIKKLGFNYRLSDINCALGISQLNKVNKFIKDRKKIYDIYEKKLQKFSNIFKIISFNKFNKPSFHLLLIHIDFKKIKSKKDNLLKFLKKNKIFAQYHYIPIYNFSVYKKKRRQFKGASKYYNSTISLPIYYGLKKQSIEKIIFLISSYLKIFK